MELAIVYSLLPDINDCHNDSCNGHGTCRDAVQSFICDCQPHYDGDYCQIGNACKLIKSIIRLCCQYRQLIPAPINRRSACAWLYRHPWIICQKDKPNASITHIPCETKLCSVIRLETCGRIHALETGWQSGVRSCIIPGLPTHLVQELNASTVHCWELKNELFECM